MPFNNAPHLYKGQGETNKSLPEFKALVDIMHPKYYKACKGLQEAVNVAISLGQPLLITGEPGTGKTQLASSIAYEYNLPLLTFQTKTTSVAHDLFYHYDAIRRFQDSQIQGKTIHMIDYISFQALGIAILLTYPKEQTHTLLDDLYKNKGPTRSVILIDEIDKAPRDLPNDVLMEIEHLSFKVKETGDTYSANHHYRPIVVLTSNSEKNLPDAFLRRCVFYHISFPLHDELKAIVTSRFKDYPELLTEFSEDYILAAVNHFEDIRKENLKKKPATAELLAWITTLQALNLDPRHLTTDMASSYSVLVKNKEDYVCLQRLLSKKMSDNKSTH